MLYRMSYAYDVVHYYDFVIEADTADEALSLAKDALGEKVFSDIEGVASYVTRDHRVRVDAEDFDAVDAGCYDRLVNGKLEEAR